MNLKTYKNFPIFFAIGGACALLDLGLLYLLTDRLGIWYLFSGMLSFLVTATLNFALNKRFTFHNDSPEYRRQYSKFILVAIMGLAINTMILFLCTSVLGVWYMASRVVASLTAMVWNYLMNSKVVFRT